MSETRRSRLRPYLLAAALGAALALAAAIPAAASPPPVLEVETGPGGSTVRYVEEGFGALQAEVVAGEDTLEVRGTAAGLDYVWWSRREADGSLQVFASLGEDAFTGLLSEGVPDSPDARAFREFRERASEGPAGALALRMAVSIGSDTRHPQGALAAAAAAAHGVADLALPAGSPFADYTGCLKASCSDCGGCWRDDLLIADCYACPGTTFWQRVLSGLCYGVQMQVCFQKHILKIIPR